MTSLLEKLATSAVSSIGRSMRAFDRLDKMLDEFDKDAFTTSLFDTRDKLIARGNRLLSDMDKFAKRIQDTVTAFNYTVPFDSKNETLQYGVENGVLTVETESTSETSSRKSTSQTTIPEDCDVSRMKHVIDDKAKMVRIIIPKKGDSIKDTTEQVRKVMDNVRAQAKGAVKIVKDGIAEAKKEAAAQPIQKKTRVNKPKAEEPKVEEPKAEAPKAKVRKTTKKPTTKVARTKKGKVKAEVKG